MTDYVFPFGQPVTSCAKPVATQHDWFVLGAYPSALHVAWTPPEGTSSPVARIAAIPVDNEPEPFWDGHDETDRIEAWKTAVGFADKWGQVSPVGKLNGSSGAWVREQVMDKFGFSRKDAVVTDCLDSYFASIDGARALTERFAPFAAAHNVEGGRLPAHPSEGQIVAIATAQHGERLVEELAAAAPRYVITLGNAALRVMRNTVMSLVESPKSLNTHPGLYGKSIPIALGDHQMAWFPLAHPAAPKQYQGVHKMFRPRL